MKHNKDITRINEDPLEAFICAITPSLGAVISFSIFMASSKSRTELFLQPYPGSP
jgi:hypothetical protein